MEDITALVAGNLKRIREEKKLSLDRLADLTGVSKSMLGQIERGETNPTISIVWKITNGLKISFTALLSAPRSDTSLVRKEDVKPMVEDGGRYRLFPIFPIGEERRFEIYAVEIDPGGSLTALAHPKGTREFISVFQGELSVGTEGEAHQLVEGDSINLRADRPHFYRNESEGTAKMHMVIQYLD